MPLGENRTAHWWVKEYSTNSGDTEASTTPLKFQGSLWNGYGLSSVQGTAIELCSPGSKTPHYPSWALCPHLRNGSKPFCHRAIAKIE